MTRWSLKDRGRALVVTDAGGGAVVVTVDGRPVADDRRGPLDTINVDLGELPECTQAVRIELGLRRQVRRVVLVERRDGARTRTPFVPPDGTRARRLYDLREEHPRAYAARHVAATAIGFLGISALISAFFARLWARIDWSWLPQLSLPDVQVPDWLRYLNPFYWFRELLSWLGGLLPDWNLLGWWPDWELTWMRYAIPLVIAVGVAAREVERRRARERREQSYREEAEPQKDTSAHG